MNIFASFQIVCQKSSAQTKLEMILFGPPECIPKQYIT